MMSNKNERLPRVVVLLAVGRIVEGALLSVVLAIS